MLAISLLLVIVGIAAISAAGLIALAADVSAEVPELPSASEPRVG